MENPSHSTNPFRRLFQIDVSKHVEKKGLFSYLSWPFAVAQLRLADPDASWEVRRFDGLPYLSSELGFFVEVAVTVQGVTLSQIHPVLDNKNRPILAPTPFDINTSIQRCLVKAIALHGLGLSIYAGEDLPDLEDAGNTGGSGNTGEDRPEAPAPVAKPRRTAAPAKVTNLPRKEDRETPQPGSENLLTAAQKKFIERLIAETGTQVAQLLAYFGFDSLETIPRSEVTRVIAALETKKRRAA
ncbi:MAG: DUF1071 domain-containing protein [Candidatus Accumulibacter sp. UW26]|jgi:hypothetical protein